MPIVQLSYMMLLSEICGILGVELPEYDVTLLAEGWFIAHIDIPILRDGLVDNVIRCWGVPCLRVETAKEDAARAAIVKIKSELDLQIKDANYDDFALYKNLYDHLFVQNNELLNRFGDLQREYQLLKETYLMGVTEKAGFITEQASMRRTIDEYRTIIDHLRARAGPAAHHLPDSASSS